MSESERVESRSPRHWHGLRLCRVDHGEREPSFRSEPQDLNVPADVQASLHWHGLNACRGGNGCQVTEGRVSSPCRHCGKPPEADGDHSCPCPYRDDECPDHPLSERTRLIREQQRDTTQEITAVMVSGDTEGRSPSCGYEWANEFHPPGSDDPARLCTRPAGHTGQHSASGWWFDTRPGDVIAPARTPSTEEASR